jgi:uncharacterized tellurite resistance protein B-like protein
MRDFLLLKVEKVVSQWSDIDPTEDELDAILEVAYLAIAADGIVTRTETEAFIRVMIKLFGPELTGDRVAEVIEQYEDALDRSGFRKRIRALTKRLDRRELREVAYQIAYAMAMCDLDTNIHEFEFAQVLQTELGLDEETTDILVDKVLDLVMVPEVEIPKGAK